jgi:hypothetical protein
MMVNYCKSRQNTKPVHSCKGEGWSSALYLGGHPPHYYSKEYFAAGVIKQVFPSPPHASTVWAKESDILTDVNHEFKLDEKRTILWPVVRLSLDLSFIRGRL